MTMAEGRVVHAAFTWAMEMKKREIPKTLK